MNFISKDLVLGGVTTEKELKRFINENVEVRSDPATLLSNNSVVFWLVTTAVPVNVNPTVSGKLILRKPLEGKGSLICTRNIRLL